MNESSNKQELVATEQNDVIIYHSKDGKINVALIAYSAQRVPSVVEYTVPG